MSSKFPISIDVKRVLSTLSEQIYDNHLAFMRENLQNAVDAVRIQALRDRSQPRGSGYRIEITITGQTVSISDNGIGMTLEDQREYFWKIGASGKRTKEAKDAGCIGSFGIGGFANLGVCNSVRIASRSGDDKVGHWTMLSIADIEQAGSGLPEVHHGVLRQLASRGTILEAQLRQPPNVPQLRRYLEDCVRYADELVVFNGERISQQALSIEGIGGIGALRLLTDTHGADTASPVSRDGRQESVRSVRCRWFEDETHELYAELVVMTVGAGPVPVGGFLRFRKGRIDVRQRGFKICAVDDPSLTRSWTPGEQLHLSGVIETDQLRPTAGRDSLDPASEHLVASLIEVIRDEAGRRILESPDRIAQYPGIYGYLARRSDYLEYLGQAKVPTTGGDEAQLSVIRDRSAGGTRVFYSKERNGTLPGHLKAHGSIVVELPAERWQAKVVQLYLEKFCGAASADELIECLEEYPEATYQKFDHVFLGELEDLILTSYNLKQIKIRAGRLSSELAAYAPKTADGMLEVFVDLRHPEVVKMHNLPQAVLTAVVRMFCQQFFGDALKKASPRFFGDGSLNFDFFKDRAEDWLLVRGEIIEFTRQDIYEVKVDEPRWEPPPGFAPKLIHLTGPGYANMTGYYLRMPGGLAKGFQNELLDLELRAATWASNRILFIASDGFDTSFNIEIKLDTLVVDGNGGRGLPGSAMIEPRMLPVYGGLYFPIPPEVEPALVPGTSDSIRIRVSYDLLGVSVSGQKGQSFA